MSRLFYRALAIALMRFVITNKLCKLDCGKTRWAAPP
jgi:hypothetical protein